LIYFTTTCHSQPATRNKTLPQAIILSVYAKKYSSIGLINQGA